MGFLDDVRYACRTLWRDPWFSCGAILALALSLGANTAVFTVVKSVLLEPLALREPGRLVALWIRRVDGLQYPFNIPNFMDFRGRNQALEDVAAYGSWNANLTGEADPQRLLGARVTGNYFEMLGVRAALGRTLQRDDDVPGRPKVAVITYGLWQRRYGGDQTIPGRTVRLNGDPHVIVGVLPKPFAFMNPNMEIAVPLSPDTDPWRTVRTSTSFLRVFGRLRPGVTLAAAQANLDAVLAGLRKEFPVANARFAAVQLIPLQDEVTGASRLLLAVLFAAVGLVLLIACANISSLLIAKAARRRKELAIRSALGGTWWRLARQMMIESLVLSGVGGAAGVLLAQWGVGLLLALSPAQLPRAGEVHLDAVVMAASLCASLVCGLLFSVMPAFACTRLDLNEPLRAAGRNSTATGSAARLRGALVVSEVGLSLVLLTCAGLVVESLHRLTATDPGFQSGNVLTLRLSLPATRYHTTEAVATFHDAVRRRLETLPEVHSVGMTSILPLSGPTASADFTIDGDPPVSEKEKPTAQYRMIDSTYFPSMRVPIVGGRNFMDQDNAKSRKVVIVSEALAKLYWRGRNPVGSQIKVEDTTGPARDAEVVGVAGSLREMSLDDPPAASLYVPLAQIPQDVVRFVTNNMFWAVRTRSRTSLAAAARREVHQVDGDVAAADMMMDEYLDRAAGTRRFSVRILGAFALAALLLAASGIYALVSYSTAQRTREMGVRMALGARQGQVAGLILGQGLRLAAIGVCLGMAASWAAARWLSSLLFDVSPHDPVILCAAGLIMLVVAAGASFLPARRAMAADPLTALRTD